MKENIDNSRDDKVCGRDSSASILTLIAIALHLKAGLTKLSQQYAKKTGLVGLADKNEVKAATSNWPHQERGNITYLVQISITHAHLLKASVRTFDAE